MAVTSGFFNSVGGDRLYEAEAFNQLFDGLLTDGVIPNVGDSLMVRAGTGMDVLVGPGRAWFNRSWIDNNSDLVVSLAPSSPGFPRWDIIVLDMNKTDGVRSNTIVLLTGVATASPVKPTLIDVEDHKQYPLAEILVPASASEIFNQDITNKVGTNDTPFATGILQQVSVEDLLIQWDAEFQDWFVNLQNQLDENQVTNLQGQINDLVAEDIAQDAVDVGLQNQVDDLSAMDALLDDRIPRYRNLLVNGRFQITQRGGPIVGVSSTAIPAGMPDRWYVGINSCGVVTPNTFTRLDDGITRRWYRLVVSTAKSTLDAASFMLLSQRIEGEKLANVYYGSPYAKEITLSYLFRSTVTGTYVAELDGIGSFGKNVSMSFNYPVASTTVKVVHTFPANTIDSITASSTEALRVNLWLAAGSTYTSGGSLQTSWGNVTNRRAYGQVNLAAAVDNRAEITDVQLEVGPKANEYERLSDHEELKLCQRYFVRPLSGKAILFQNSSTTGVFDILYPTPMRSTPTITNIASSQVGNDGITIAIYPTPLSTYDTFVTMQTSPLPIVIPGDGVSGVYYTVELNAEL